MKSHKSSEVLTFSRLLQKVVRVVVKAALHPLLRSDLHSFELLQISIQRVVKVALSILSMAGSTIIMNKTQKTQMQLSSVDGDNSTAASTQKMMTWMMPVMFGVFSFIYSAAFSIYMVTNSLLSTGSTILINIIVEKSFKKKIEAAEKEKLENHKYGKMR